MYLQMSQEKSDALVNKSVDVEENIENQDGGGVEEIVGKLYADI